MEKIIDLIHTISREDDDMISPTVVNKIASFMEEPNYKVLKSRARKWSEVKPKFFIKTMIGYAKLFFMKSGNEKFLLDDVGKWPLKQPMSDPYEELFIQMHHNKYMISEKEAFEKIMEESKTKKISEEMATFLETSFEPLIEELLAVPEIKSPFGEICKRKTEFPFLKEPQPDGLFCDFIYSHKLESIMSSMCEGNNKSQINQMGYDAAWKLADKKYFTPWVIHKLRQHGYLEDEEDEQPTLLMIHEAVKDVQSGMMKLSVPVEQTTIVHHLNEIKDQLLSLGLAKPMTEIDKPAYVLPSISEFKKPDENGAGKREELQPRLFF